jgi:hypothetical protein
MGDLIARSASVSVNGGAGILVSFPQSGYDWANDIWRSFRVELSGFRIGSNNTILVKAGDTDPAAPDIDRIGIIV